MEEEDQTDQRVDNEDAIEDLFSPEDMKTFEDRLERRVHTWHCFTWSEAARHVHSSSPFTRVDDRKQITMND